jgi:hypothetical protein
LSRWSRKIRSFRHKKSTSVAVVAVKYDPHNHHHSRHHRHPHNHRHHRRHSTVVNANAESSSCPQCNGGNTHTPLSSNHATGRIVKLDRPDRV